MKVYVSLLLMLIFHLNIFSQSGETYSNFILPEKIQESSGLIYDKGLLWTHNDDSDTKIYGIDPITKTIVSSVDFPTLKIRDWEELQHDSLYYYVGDIGNNYKGNRTDLTIYKINKVSFKVDKIQFKYDHQKEFTEQKPNKTNFDSESFLVTDSSIYIFTKEWSSKNVSQYKIPNKAGNHIAKKMDEITTGFLVTGAAFSPDRKSIALCGYTPTLNPHIVIINDYSGDHFLTGKKNKIPVNGSFLQVEGITYINPSTVAISSEYFKKSILSSKGQIQFINIEK